MCVGVDIAANSLTTKVSELKCGNIGIENNEQRLNECLKDNRYFCAMCAQSVLGIKGYHESRMNSCM